MSVEKTATAARACSAVGQDVRNRTRQGGTAERQEAEAEGTKAGMTKAERQKVEAEKQRLPKAEAYLSTLLL